MRFAITAVSFCCAAMMLPVPQAHALVREEFHFTGGEQTFVVPAGVHNLRLGAEGGEGGGTADAAGGSSVGVAGFASVNPGQTLFIEVGGDGKSQAEGGAGGFNGGGSASGGGGGGGASDVRTSPRSSGLSPDTRLIVAAGGGGAGGTGPQGEGGVGGAAGEEGGEAEGGNTGGNPGFSGEGGAGGSGCFDSGEMGGLGLGGAGAAGEEGTNGGGGGGGGLFGGGGGGGGCSFGGGGGGGGFSLVPPGGLEILSSTPPGVAIEFTKPPTIEIASPIDGATFTQGQAVTASFSCSAEVVPIVTCTGSVPSGSALDTSTTGQHTLTVEAVDGDEGTASKTVSYSVSAPAAPSASLPNTTITSHPKKTVKTSKSKTKIKFSFSSDAPGATFQCMIDRGAFASCTSPKSFKAKPGKHTFSVEAVGQAGPDASPATFSFKVKKKK
jgi:hypothetical protein